MGMEKIDSFEHCFHLSLPLSKSVLIRKLIVSFLYEDKILSISPHDAEDIKIVHRNLLKISQSTKLTSSQETIIDVEDCGLAYRCFFALLAITKGKWILTGHNRLLERPIAPLEKTLLQAGADIQKITNGFLIHGKELSISQVIMEGGISSQWVTAMLLIANKINLKELTLSSPVLSYPYLELTSQLLIQSGVNLEVKENRFIFNDQKGKNISCRHIIEEGDWSAAAYWYAVAALFPNYCFYLYDLSFDDLQGDRIISQWFEHFGVISAEVEDGIVIKNKGEKIANKLSLDLSGNPDLAPIIAVLAILLPCDLTLSGVEALNVKESKRLDILYQMLSNFTTIEVEEEKKISIPGTSRQFNPKIALQFPSHNDHRIVMAFSLFSFFTSVEFDNPTCVKKSYPTFWDDVSEFRNMIINDK